MTNDNELVNRINAVISRQLKGEQVELLPMLSMEQRSFMPIEQVSLYDNFREMQL
ncbi:MAG: hypothetical protein PHX54_03670 [Lentimicrobiaceae bacterium]|nr:hypothetical protein [Lentimicrobiaceae bacterium]